MKEPTKTIITRGKQDFELYDQLNPIEIKIDDEQVINLLKNTKAWRITLFQLAYYFRRR